MSIYTKKGDKGKTSIFKGKSRRISKNSQIINTLGTLDELNSFLGVVKEFSKFNKKEIFRIQSNIMTIASILAGSNLTLSGYETKRLEKKIDQSDEKLTRLNNFIIPGGSEESALLNYSRTLARRAEREIVSLIKKNKINPEILKYINRLSDYLFMLARDANRKKGIKEIIWKNI
jgi:cob(I)alamin adenosyltransferase